MGDEFSKALDREAILGLTPLIRLDRLRPGDVLLTRGGKPSSTAIALATDGVYSHAAMWLPTRRLSLTS